MSVDRNKLYTCYPLTSEHDFPHCYEVKLLSWDGDKYCTVEYNGTKYSFKIGYLSDIVSTGEPSSFLSARLGRKGWLKFLDSIPVDNKHDPSVIGV